MIHISLWGGPELSAVLAVCTYASVIALGLMVYAARLSAKNDDSGFPIRRAANAHPLRG